MMAPSISRSCAVSRRMRAICLLSMPGDYRAIPRPKKGEGIQFAPQVRLECRKTPGAKPDLAPQVAPKYDTSSELAIVVPCRLHRRSKLRRLHTGFRSNPQNRRSGKGVLVERQRRK